MDKKKQIEEMVKVMENWAYRNGMLWHEGHAISLCEALLDAGYRKIPEGAVVLTREEYEQIQDRVELLKENEDIGNALFRSNELCRKLIGDKKKLKQSLKHAHKETAEKFAERLKKVIHERDYVEGYAFLGICEEIDEICKELTEG